MTSDAKIGLLLGLVFIFIIAFVINGLPRFKSVLAENELTLNANPSEERATPAQRARQAQSALELETQQAEEPVQTEPVASNNQRRDNQFGNYGNLNNNNNANNSVLGRDFSNTNYRRQNSYINQEGNPFSENPFTSGLQFGRDNSSGNEASFLFGGNNQPNNTDTPAQEANGQEEVRYVANLPGSNPIEQETTPASQSYSNNTPNQNRNNFRTNQGGIGNQSSESSREAEPVRPTTPVQQTKRTTYIIQEGDGNLANIAKKFYGEDEGNRIVNVNRIYEANRNVLKSADEIYVGQKITIPALPASESNNQKSDEIFSGPMFEKVDSIDMPSPGGWYVVKENDSLWDIAAKELGKGSRYKEIIELNKQRIPNENRLDPGLRLRMPVK